MPPVRNPIWKLVKSEKDCQIIPSYCDVPDGHEYGAVWLGLDKAALRVALMITVGSLKTSKAPPLDVKKKCGLCSTKKFRLGVYIVVPQLFNESTAPPNAAEGDSQNCDNLLGIRTVLRSVLPPVTWLMCGRPADQHNLVLTLPFLSSSNTFFFFYIITATRSSWPSSLNSSKMTFTSESCFTSGHKKKKV